MKTAATTVLFCIVLLALLLAESRPVEAEVLPFAGKIRITQEGVVEGTDKINQNGNVYTLTGDISGSVEDGRILISIERDGVILDGADRTIQGTGTGIAIAAYGRKDVTIKNVRIVDFGTGIELRPTAFESNSTASNNRILDNYVETKYWGIDLNTNRGVVSGNKIVAKNSIYGVNFQSNNTVFYNNTLVNCGLVVFRQCFLNTFSGNTINDKPLIYLEHQANQVIDGGGQVFLSDCTNMIIRNVETVLNLRMTIELFRTSNTRVTNCKGNIVLRDSHSNTILNNQLSDVGSAAKYGSSAIELSGSQNNSIADNLILATGSFGVALAGSSYNKVFGNKVSSTGQAGIKIESTSEYQAAPEFNYIYGNSVTCPESGISFRTGAKHNSVFKNNVFNCKNAIALYSGYENNFLGNNISGSTQYAVYLSISDNNCFFHNNFRNNSKSAYENHEVYWWSIQNNTFYSENNTWDNGIKGNYWDDYTGSDKNGDGIGETPYGVYENFSDYYPLTAPFDTDSVAVGFRQWSPSSIPEEPQPIHEMQIIVLSPENTTYITVNVPLNLIASDPVSWLGYSIDSQPNATLTANTTLTDVSPGTHSLTVYGNSTEGVVGVSQTVFFTVSVAEPVPTAAIAAVAVASAGTVVAVAAVVYIKKRRT